MKKTNTTKAISSSRSIRFTEEGLDAIKTITADFPGLSRSAVINAVLINHAEKMAATRPIQFATLNAADLMWIRAMVKEVVKELREFRRHVVGEGIAHEKPELLATLSEKLEKLDSVALNLAGLAGFSYGLTSEEAELLETRKKTLDGLIKNKFIDPEESRFHLLEFKLFSILLHKE
jgi:hypothetical protein